MRDGQKWPLRIELVRFRLFNFNLSVFSGASLGLHVESVLLKGVPLRHTLSRQCNSLKLDVGVLWERLNSNTAASRLVGEPLAVLLVHGLKRDKRWSAWWPRCRRAHSAVQRTAKSFMSLRKMLTLTTLLMSEPAATRTALRLRMQAAVFSWMVPWIRLPSGSKWIWPEQ
ncbi:hypothetical protein FJTKL_14841 [Diaporthe vaccinii]|uniref:Uncharacterized protein n=1 Tax=Diaporthe vaccinii TaxID=105482 RepID=A0ABR4F866_9PEZI